jgi:hypothetical protein
MAKWVNEGENRVADILFGSQAVDATLYLGLYTDLTEPAETITLATIAEETGDGYARIALTRGAWTVTGDYATYAQQTFTADGGDWGNVYGYFICTTSSGTEGKILGVEHFTNGPYNIYNGDSIRISPKVTIS